MEQKLLEELHGLLADINPVEISSHVNDGTLFSWLGSWRFKANTVITFLMENEKRKNTPTSNGKRKGGEQDG